jgi:N6-L-threonylcarbamoyladenine synthase
MNKKPTTILGIETSCDETSVAVYQGNKHLLSHVTYSQIEIHKKFGGVIPEIASRSQLEKIYPVVEQALTQAAMIIDDIDVIAVTCKPGLPGSLLVGVAFAKALAWSAGKKLIGVDHIEGHTFSAFLEYDIPFPHLCLTASGGHTSVHLVTGFGEYTLLGETIDDAAGEAFDKIAKLLELPYPGGPEIEKRARLLNFVDTKNYPRSMHQSLNFSFSGIKTAVLYDLVKQGAYDLPTKTLLDRSDELKNIVSSALLVCVGDIFEQKLALALAQHPEVTAITFVGGVACNKYLKQRLETFATRRNKQFFSPKPQFCTDNGAMIAFVGAYKAEQGLFNDLSLDIL